MNYHRRNRNLRHCFPGICHGNSVDSGKPHPPVSCFAAGRLGTAGKNRRLQPAAFPEMVITAGGPASSKFMAEFIYILCIYAESTFRNKTQALIGTDPQVFFIIFEDFVNTGGGEFPLPRRSNKTAAGETDNPAAAGAQPQIPPPVRHRYPGSYILIRPLFV